MPIDDIDDGESGASARAKLNAAFAQLNALPAAAIPGAPLETELLTIVEGSGLLDMVSIGVTLGIFQITYLNESGQPVILSYNPATDMITVGKLTASLFVGNHRGAHSTLTYAGTTALDFDNDNFRTITLTGNITFTTSNRGAPKSITVKIIGDSSLRTFTFPAWKFVGAAAPASLAASKVALMTLTCFGSADTDIIAAYAAEP